MKIHPTVVFLSILGLAVTRPLGSRETDISARTPTSGADVNEHVYILPARRNDADENVHSSWNARREKDADENVHSSWNAR